MKLIPPLIAALIFFSSFTLFFGPEKVSISCSEQDASIFVDGILVGNGNTKISLRKGECVNVRITKTGFIPVEKNYCDKKGNTFPEKDFIKLIADEAYISSVTNQVANTDMVIKVETPGLESWKALSNVILSYFDVLELTDKETSYLRTAWATQIFNAGTVRTRVIVKNDPSGYKVKLVSEISGSVMKGQSDESFRPWDRTLRKYENLISDLQARVK